MLEWKPQLAVALVLLAALAAALGFVFSPSNFGWGTW